MKVTVLGSAAMFQRTDRAASGYLVEMGGKRIWMDAGAGTWRNLIDRVHYRDLDGVILTHRHPDHVTDVFQAFHALRYGSEEPMPRIPLWAPQETCGALIDFVTAFDEAFDMRMVSAGDRIDVAGAEVSFFQMAHPPETLGVRIERDGAVLAYTADTGPTGDLAGLSRGADVLICEATFQDSDPEWDGHLRASEAGSIASANGVKSLVLTHLPHERDLSLSLAQASKESGDTRVRLANDGLEIEVTA